MILYVSHNRNVIIRNKIVHQILVVTPELQEVHDLFDLLAFQKKVE